ncbi:hypothetical protein [Cellulomonas sp. URHD0024]|uniref:hypothetical protein n=1 Tax=Cellulomonas sp. URHD0024 TaxID=1302620 RepID=UPI0003FCA716|nr:hypothetical protein [Cellulomonas sp. URHD0024]
MLLPIRLVRGGWPRWLERRAHRFFYTDPAVLVDDDASPEDYRSVMLGIHIGGTIKITAAGRHLDIDPLLLDNVDLAGARIVDIGASDGSTSMDLIDALPEFASYTISDLYIEVPWARTAKHLFLFDKHQTSILVAGRRFLAWPELSRTVAALYAPLVRRGRKQPQQLTTLLNPQVRARMRTDPRVTYREHDVFETWAGERPDVIKVGNLLRRFYFDDADLSRALRAVHASLADDGHFFIVDHTRDPGRPPAGGLYRRTPAGFARVATTPTQPEIEDLILAVDVSELTPRTGT